jgi:hypothetical protein
LGSKIMAIGGPFDCAPSKRDLEEFASVERITQTIVQEFLYGRPNEPVGDLLPALDLSQPLCSHNGQIQQCAKPDICVAAKMCDRSAACMRLIEDEAYPTPPTSEKRIDEMTLADYRRGISKDFDKGRLLP